MSSDWKDTLIGDICEVKSGKRLPLGHTLSTVPTQFPYIRLVDISNGRIQKNGLLYLRPETRAHIKRYVVNAGDVCLAIVGHTIGMVFYVDHDFDDANLTENAARLTSFKESVNPRYVYYYLISSIGQNAIQARKVGSAQGKLPLYNIKSFPVFLPSRDVQDEVVRTLNALDDRITLLRETNKTLESIAQAIFKSWFVDFDPVRAKMEGRQPEGMDEDTAALFPDSFEESELGLVPRGWQIRKFLETVDVIGGGTPKTSNPDYWNGGIPWFSVVDAPELSDVWVVRTEKKISEKGLNESSTKLLPVGTTIISARGTVGKLALTGREMAMNQSCYGLRGKYDDVFFTYFSTKRLVDSLRQHSHGSVFDTITKDTLSRVKVVLPAIACLEKFEQAVDLVMKQMLAQSERGYCISQIRDTLLPRLISGQLRLPEAQEQIEAALS